MTKKWLNYSYGHFYNDFDYLYLGSRGARAPSSYLYGNMFSHYRSRYAVFHYRRMWVNYIKKINLLKRLYNNPSNHFFFITNKIEHIRLLSGHAARSGANVIFHEKAGQFAFKFFKKDMREIMDGAVGGFGASNQYSYGDFISVSSRVFFSLSNSKQDAPFFKDLFNADVEFALFSTADADSIHLQNFVSFFGNNDNLKSWQFFFRLFENASAANKASRPSGRFSNLKFGTDILRKSYNFAIENKLAPCRPLFYKLDERRKILRSMRAWNLLKSKKSLIYDSDNDVFGYQKRNFNYV